MGKMRNVHPGEIIKMELAEGRKLSITETAELLKTTRINMLSIFDGHKRISEDLATSLENVFGGKVEVFLRLQSNYDLKNKGNI